MATSVYGPGLPEVVPAMTLRAEGTNAELFPQDTGPSNSDLG